MGMNIVLTKKGYGGRLGTLEDIRVAEDKEGKLKHDKFISRLKEQFWREQSAHRWHPGIYGKGYHPHLKKRY